METNVSEDKERSVVMNYMEVRGINIMYQKYIYVDSVDYKADSILNNVGIRIKYLRDYAKKGERYVICYCKVMKDDIIRFELGMEELKKKMLICGYNDYEEWCEEIFKKLLRKG